MLGLYFKKYRKLKIQVFGKLPIYKDYISIITQTEAIKWKDWLLKNFRHRDELPAGRWPFIFQFSNKSSCLVVGLIEKSSDGQRVFPFSLFVVWYKTGINKNDFLERFNFILKHLETIRNELEKIKNINECYEHLKGRMLHIENKQCKGKLQKTSFNLKSFYPNHKNAWPLLFVWPKTKGKQCFVMDKNTSIFKKFKELEEIMNISGIEEIKERIENCLSPFKGNKLPVGENVKEHEDYQLIKNEIDKVTLGGNVDWNVVIENSLKILSESSKDLNIAGYLCLGLFKRYGYQGLLYGLIIYYGIIKNFENDNYFPNKKYEGKIDKKKTDILRRNTVNMLNEQLFEYLKIQKVEDSDIKFVSEILKIIENLINEISDISPDNPPSLSLVFDKIKSYHAILAENNISKSQQTHKDKNINIQKDVFSMLIDIANEIFSKSPQSPISYKIRRIVKWNKDGIKLPEIKQNKKDKKITEFPPPITNRKSLLPPNNPLEIIKQCEDIFVNNGTWCLDLNRYVVEAMERSEDDFDDAIDAIKKEVLAFVKRFPDVYEMKYLKGIPFADQETKECIDEIIELNEGTPQKDTVIPISSEFKTNFDEVWELVRKKDISGALELLQNGISTGIGQKNEFYHRLIVAKIYFKYNREKESIMILENLFIKAQYYHLEEWEPELFINLCLMLDKAYRKISNGALSNKLAEIRKIILKYDFKIPLGLPAI